MTIRPKTFTIDYRVHCKDGSTYHPLKMKVKNCTNDFFAVAKLEKHIERKYTGFSWMEVIDCKEDIFGSDLFDGIFNRKGR